MARWTRSLAWLAELLVDEDDVKRLQPGARLQVCITGLGLENLPGQVAAMDAVRGDQRPPRCWPIGRAARY